MTIQQELAVSLLTHWESMYEYIILWNHTL